MLTGSTRRISLAIFAAVVAASTQAQAHSSSCTPAHLASAVKQVEAECGSAKVISAHRPGARIRGTGHISQHALCDGTHGAIDAVFSNRACALSALRKTNYTIITYGRSSPHIHIGTDGWRNGVNTLVARRNNIITPTRMAARQRAGTRYASQQRAGIRYASRQRAGVRVAAAQWPGEQNSWDNASSSDAGWSNRGSAEAAYAQRPGARSSSRQRVRVAARQRSQAQDGWNDASWSGDASWSNGSSRSGGRTRLSRSSQASNTNWSSDW